MRLAVAGSSEQPAILPMPCPQEIERLPGGRGFVIRASLPDEALPASTDEPDAERLAVRSAGVVNRAMERLIRQNPGQYLWGYHRYKAPRALAEPAPAPASDASA